MLKVEERFMIKEMAREGVSISEIARRSGRDRKTVRRMLAEPVMVEQPSRREQKKKLDPYLPYLKKRIEAGVPRSCMTKSR
jgi:transposase